MKRVSSYGWKKSPWWIKSYIVLMSVPMFTLFILQVSLHMIQLPLIWLQQSINWDFEFVSIKEHWGDLP